jgi:hypothetical protein
MKRVQYCQINLTNVDLNYCYPLCLKYWSSFARICIFFVSTWVHPRFFLVGSVLLIFLTFVLSYRVSILSEFRVMRSVAYPRENDVRFVFTRFWCHMNYCHRVAFVVRPSTLSVRLHFVELRDNKLWLYIIIIGDALDDDYTTQVWYQI